MRDYVFSFDFEKYNMSHYMTKFLKEHEIDYFWHFQEIYADLFGTGTYYKLVVEHVAKHSFDVYYDLDRTQKREYFERKFPLKEKAIRVDYPYRTVTVTFADGDRVTTTICGHKDKIINYYLNKNHFFNTGSDSDNLQNAVKVEFIA